MSTHAILSPSGASRWLACTPSARLEETFPDRAGEVAAEGTLAHALGELLLRLHTKAINKKAFDKEFKRIQIDPLYDNSMQDYAEDYATFVLERFAEAQAHTKDAMLFLEQKLDLTEYVPDGFGTGDALIIADRTLDIIDLKYGKGVAVFSEKNKQMMLYGLGALRAFDFIYAIDVVRMTIYQPRIDNISTWEIPATELREWAETELRTKAAMAFEGEGEFVPGSHCQFCKAKAVCKAHAEMHLEAAKYEFKEAVLLNDEEVADILNRADAFNKWLNAVQDHALREAVENGKKWPGYKLVEGRSNRMYSDETKVADRLVSIGFKEEVIYTKKLLGITAMEKEITKKVFAENLNDLIIKPDGKPTLVPASDKRPELNSMDAAKADFQTVETDEA